MSRPSRSLMYAIRGGRSTDAVAGQAAQASTTSTAGTPLHHFTTLYVPGIAPGQSLRSGRGRLFHAARHEHLARDHEPLDLRRPLVELHDLRVAHQLLDRVLLD